MNNQQLIDKLFNNLYKHWFVDSDIIDEDNTDITRECEDILKHYKSHSNIALFIYDALRQRNYIQDDFKLAKWFIMWFIVSWESDQ